MARTILRSLWGRQLGLDVDGNLVVAGGAISPDAGTASGSGGASTLSKMSGKITTESLTTAQNAKYTHTITNTKIAATDIVMVSIANGTNSQGTPLIERVTPAAGSVAIVIANKHDSAQALNGTLVISFVVFKV
jgi:hypothetical protein